MWEWDYFFRTWMVTTEWWTHVGDKLLLETVHSLRTVIAIHELMCSAQNYGTLALLFLHELMSCYHKWSYESQYFPSIFGILCSHWDKHYNQSTTENSFDSRVSSNLPRIWGCVPTAPKYARWYFHKKIVHLFSEYVYIWRAIWRRYRSGCPCHQDPK